MDGAADLGRVPGDVGVHVRDDVLGGRRGDVLGGHAA